MKRLSKIIVGMILLAALFLVPTTIIQASLTDDKAESQKQIEEFNKLIKDANGNLEIIIAKVYEVEAKIKAIDKQLAKINADIKEIESDVKVKETEIARAKADYDNKKSTFFQNLRSDYEKGGVNYTEVILDSADLTDFINYNEYIRVIKEVEKEKINEIVAAKKALEAQRAELKKTQDSLSKKKADVVAQKKQQSIEKQKLDSQKAYFATLVSKYKAAKAKEEAELAAINKKIQDAIKNSNGGLVYTGNGIFTWPVPSSNRISSDYGWRSSPIFGGSEFHKGIDISASGGSTIVAVEDGVVLLSYYSSSFGNTVVINHGSGLMTLYAHMSTRSVSAGASVSRGQKIGAVGSTGWSTGNHLHFQVTDKGDIFSGYVDPNKYLSYR